MLCVTLFVIDFFLLLALFRLSITLQKIQCCLTWIDYFSSSFYFTTFLHNKTWFVCCILLLVYNRATQPEMNIVQNVYISELMLRACESVRLNLILFSYLVRRKPTENLRCKTKLIKLRYINSLLAFSARFILEQ